MRSFALLALAGLLAARVCSAQADSARAVHVITVGSSIAGTLTHKDSRTADGTYAQAWRLTGPPGLTVTVDLASRDFDAFVMARGPGLDSAGLQDDDSGGHCNARLTFRIPASGQCTIVVTTSSRDNVGDFTLAVRHGAIAPSLAPCHG